MRDSCPRNGDIQKQFGTTRNNIINKVAMQYETYYLDTGNNHVYFNVTDGMVTCAGHVTQVSTTKLLDFLAIARVLGFKTGKL